MATSGVESLENSPPFRATRNYTSLEDEEHDGCCYYVRRGEDRKKFYSKRDLASFLSKEAFRTRRDKVLKMRFENSNEIGVFMKLTNTYCLTCKNEEIADHFLNTIRNHVPLGLDVIPIINTSVAGCRVIGTMCVGNNKGLLVPDKIYNTELQHITNELPDSVKVQRVEDRLSALGNVIVCNDSVAIIHPDIDKETEEIIKDTLQVEVFRHMIANNPLIGSYCVLNNNGGIICPGVSSSELENLASLLQIPIAAGTVNSGSKSIAAGLVVNDWIAYAGMKTTSNEFSVIASIFHSTSLTS